MKIVFRTDVNREIGIGHFQRCIALADGLLSAGHQCYFLIEPGMRLSADSVPKRFGIKLLNTLNPKSLTHLRNCCNEARQKTITPADFPDWLVVDDYRINRHWEEQMRPNVRRILVIDDLANRHHDCDVLLDNALIRQRGDYIGLVSDTTQILVGPEFVLLRPQFREMRKVRELLSPKASVNKVFVSMGGTDPHRRIRAVLAAIEKMPHSATLTVNVVVSSLVSELNNLRALMPNLNYRAHLHVDAENIAAIMACSDVAVSAGGFTSYELACLRIPTLIIPASEIQALVAEALAEEACIIFLDCSYQELQRQELDLELKLDNAINKLWSAFSDVSRWPGPSSVLDGRGLDRVISVMEEEYAQRVSAEPGANCQKVGTQNRAENTLSFFPSSAKKESVKRCLSYIRKRLR